MTDTSVKGPAFPRRDVLVFILLACAVPLWYAVYTNHIWEDFFITFRYSKNLCEGHGLVYNPGERVHGFTSPLGVLLPAFCYLATGGQSFVPAIWLFRIFSTMAFCMGGLLVFWTLKRAPQGPPFLKYAFAVLFAFEAKSVPFSVNGMETGFVLLFLGWGIYLLYRNDPATWVQWGLCWAGMMWTRPDGCISIAALIVAHLVFFRDPGKKMLTAFLRSGLLAVALYLPWFLWAWSYYGSPIPNTILAKAPASPGQVGIGTVLQTMYQAYPLRAAQAFAPIYFPGPWDKPAWIGRVSYALGIFCSLYWLFPTRDRLGRAASLGFFILCLYFSYMINFFPWYAPPATLFGLITLVSSMAWLAGAVAGRPWVGRSLAVSGLGLVCLEMVAVFAMTARLMRVQEKDVEMGNRARIGLWLKDHMKPHETLFLEPLGYIGYFSEAHTMDWPGLVSPRIVHFIRDQHRNLSLLIQPDFQPDWVVLRPGELHGMLAGNSFFKEHYAPVEIFDMHQRLIRYAKLPGIGYAGVDAAFWVYKRKS